MVAGCASVRWSGGPRPAASQAAFAVSSSSAAVPVPQPSPPAVDASRGGILYYSDLGPDFIDVSSYPAQQRYNYGVYAEVCSRCHTLARSVNAPIASRRFWELYVLGMRMAVRVKGGAAITKAQRRAVLDFLEYDSRERRFKHARQFEALTEELKRRYEPLLRSRLEELQQSSQPVLFKNGR
ncbi:MAG: hypothetical protein KGK30_03095 [Elusimicrobia bacterium]|nr:hypothetical protein [Elusimicrobiota bacterium]